MNSKILGVDVGGVIIDRQNDRTDTSFFGPNYLQTTPVPGVFDALRQTVDLGFTVHIVSKCGENTQRKTLEWLAYHNFYSVTGVEPGRVHFCRTRPQKAPICSFHGVNYFVDDRLDVLEYLTDVARLFLFQPNAADAARWSASGHRSLLVKNWEEALLEIAGAPVR